MFGHFSQNKLSLLDYVAPKKSPKSVNTFRKKFVFKILIKYNL